MKLVLAVISYIGLRENIPTIHSSVETNISRRESSSLLHIKKVAQLDYPDNGFKSTKLTGPGQDIGRQAGTSYNNSVESVEVRDEEGWVSKGGIISCQPDFVTPIPSQGVEVAQKCRFL